MKIAYKTILTLSLLCHVFAAEPEHIDAAHNTPNTEKTAQAESFFSKFITFKKPSTQNEWLAFGKRYLEFQLAQEELEGLSEKHLPAPIEKKEFKNKAVLERAQKQARQKGQCYALLSSHELSRQEYGLFNTQDLLSTFNAFHKHYHLAKRSIDEKICFFPKTMTGEASDISWGYAYKDPLDLDEFDKIRILKFKNEREAEEELTLSSLFEDFYNFQDKLSFMKVYTSIFNFLRIVIFPMLDWNKIRDEVRARTQDPLYTSIDMEKLSDKTLEECLKSEKAVKPVVSQIVNWYQPQMADFLKAENITTLSTVRDNPHEIPLLNVSDLVEGLRSLKQLHEHLEALKSFIKEIKQAPQKFNYKDFTKEGRAHDILMKFRSAYISIIKPLQLEGQYTHDFKRVLLKEKNPDTTLAQLCKFHLEEESVLNLEKSVNTITKRYLDIYNQTYVTPLALLEFDSMYLFSKTHNADWLGRIFEDLACFVSTATRAQVRGFLKNVPNTAKYVKEFKYDKDSNLAIRQGRLDNEIKALEEVLQLNKDHILKLLVEEIGQDKSLKYLKLVSIKYSLESLVFGSLQPKLPDVQATIQQFKETYAAQIPELKEEVRQKLAAVPSKTKKKKKKKLGKAVLETPSEQPAASIQESNLDAQAKSIQTIVTSLEPQQAVEESMVIEQALQTHEIESSSIMKPAQGEKAEHIDSQAANCEPSEDTVSVYSIELEEQKQLNQQLRDDLFKTRSQLEQVRSEFEAERKVSASTSKQYLEVTQELSKLEAEKAELQKNFSELEAELRSVKEKASQRELEMSTKIAEQSRSIASLSRLNNDLKKENAAKSTLEAENSRQRERITELEEIAKTRLSKNKEQQRELKTASEALELTQRQARLQELFLKAAQQELAKKTSELESYKASSDHYQRRSQELLIENSSLVENNRALTIQNTGLDLIIQDPDRILSKFQEFLGEVRFQNFLKHLEQSSTKTDQ